ncbi:MAG: tRNA (adenosine(37)-N6)-threonylcarbamoyltransferase complex dimerization subunit type 1 TsaB [Microbacteriaceae bacterium]
MSPFLAIDTSVGTSVALVAGGDVLAEVNFDDRMGHAENIGNALIEVFSKAGIAPARISAVVVGRGPAPFTGLRVGIAAAIAFAEGVAKPIFGVVSHDAIALAAIRGGAKPSEGQPLLVTTDARRSEVYWSLYSCSDSHGVPLRVDGPHVAKPATLEELLAGREVLRTEASVTAVDLAIVAERQMLAGLLRTDLSALYLRDPDAVAPKPHVRLGKAVSE